MEESHVVSAGARDARVHFFVGDTQAHSWETSENPPSSLGPEAISVLMNRVLAAEAERFGSENVVWTVGNNDGE